MMSSSFSQDEKELIARAAIPADNVDLSMFSEELQSELIREAISILCEEAKNGYHVESAKKAVEFYKRINDPHKWIAKIDLEALVREDNSDEVSEVVLAGLGRNDELKERARGYLFGENCKGHSSADIKDTLRALEYAGIKSTPEDIRKLSQDVLLSKHPLAIENWICGYGLLNEKPEIPKDKLNKILHTCNSYVFGQRSNPNSAFDLARRIAIENKDRILELADAAFDNKDLDSAALLYIWHFASKIDDKSKSKLREINEIHIRNARSDIVQLICYMIKDEVPYRALYLNFRRNSLDKRHRLWSCFNVVTTSSVLLQAPKDALEEILELAEQEGKSLMNTDSVRLKEQASDLYRFFAIRAYLKLGKQDAAKNLIDKLPEDALDINFLEKLDMDYAKNKAVEIKQKQRKAQEEYEKKNKPKEEPKTDLYELIKSADVAKDIKAAYESAGFNGVAESISKLSEKYKNLTAFQGDAVSVYHFILTEVDKRKFDYIMSDGTAFNDKEADAAVEYCLLNNVRWGIPSRLISQYTSEPELRKRIKPAVWLQAATVAILPSGMLDSSDIKEAIEFTKCAGVKPSKKLYTELGFQELSYAASQRQSREGKWDFNTTYMWSAREAFKKGDHPELVDFINKNYSSFFKE